MVKFEFEQENKDLNPEPVTKKKVGVVEAVPRKETRQEGGPSTFTITKRYHPRFKKNGFAMLM